MKAMLDAFWRAAAYCLHPRVIVLSVLPLLIAGGLAAGLGFFFWEQTLDDVRSTLQGWAVLETMLSWLDSIGAGGFRAVLAPLIIVALAVPLIVVLSLLLVALLMTPAVVTLVAKRRFAHLERLRGAGWLQSLVWSLGCTLAALVALVISIPFWFVPPLILILPPLIWGWLTYRVLSFDALAEHASREERQAIMREQRWPLIGMGVVTGYLGAAPSLLWAVSAAFLVLAPVLIVAAVWLYTLVFAFSTLWFTHFLLAALDALRQGAKLLPSGFEPALLPAAGEARPPLLPAP